MRKMIRILKSYLMGLKASSRFGRANSLRKKGNVHEAPAIARDALRILGSPVVERQHPSEAAVLMCLTIFVEELSSELQQPGASMNDLVDTLKFIKQLPAECSMDLQNMKEWVEYLETKIGNV